MSLIVEIRINEDIIRTFYARRIEGTTDIDSIGRYEVGILDKGYTFIIGYVFHRYGDGATVLTRKMMEVAHKDKPKDIIDFGKFRWKCPKCLKGEISISSGTEFYLICSNVLDHSCDFWAYPLNLAEEKHNNRRRKDI